MAGSRNPDYNAAMQSLPVPDSDSLEAQPSPMIDWAAPIPGPMNPLVDALVGDEVTSGQPFVRVISPGGQSDVPDGSA